MERPAVTSDGIQCWLGRQGGSRHAPQIRVGNHAGRGAAYAVWPRRADLRAFEPAGMAQFETAMWRDYYEKRYPALFYHLYEMSRTQFGFSPSDSLRIALAAARAAKAFQPTR